MPKVDESMDLMTLAEEQMMGRQHPDEESFWIRWQLNPTAEEKRVVAGMGMTTNSVSVSSGDCGTFVIARFDESGAVDEGSAG
mmetsp:Transcript_50115/g.98105  ORF Transcript_50115/g.98105 Transcript_50115/m.98105 type:complete len:83 (+) Transcript_50115:203-451(+)